MTTLRPATGQTWTRPVDSVPIRTLEEVRRSVHSVRPTDVLALLGALAAATGVTALLFTQLLPWSGMFGFLVVAFVVFIGVYALLVSMDETGPVVRDRIASVLLHSVAALMLTALVFVIAYTLWRGRRAVTHLNFFTQDMADAGPLQSLSVGGIWHAILGTLIMISIALAVTVPLGITCAVFLNEVPGAFARFVRTIVEAMTALPSIVAGLFIYATLILALGFEKSGLAAAIAISVEMLPIIVRAADVVLRLVPGTLREAAYGVGSSSWRAVWHVVLPTARSGLATAVILGTARGIGETAPVLLTAGFTPRSNVDPLHEPMVSLPLATLAFVKSGQPNMVSRGFGTAATLMVLVLLLFLVARVIGGRGAGQLSRRQTRRRVRASTRDSRRWASSVESPKSGTQSARTT
jgi:phosphate transport system permease protein